MANVVEIEESIQTLQDDQFFSLMGWMTERHLEILSSGGFETQELEMELLKSLNSPRHPIGQELFDSVRAMARTAAT